MDKKTIKEMLPEVAVKIEEGYKYLMVVGETLPPGVMEASQAQLNKIYGVGVVALVCSDSDIKLYKIE